MLGVIFRFCFSFCRRLVDRGWVWPVRGESMFDAATILACFIRTAFASCDMARESMSEDEVLSIEPFRFRLDEEQVRLGRETENNLQK